LIDRLVADHRQALATDPENVVLLSNLGALLLQLGRAEESAMHVRKALALAPGTPEVLLNIGDIERLAGRHVEAALDFRRVLALRPRLPEAWNNLGISLLGVGDIEAATACFATAVETRGDYAEALNNLGNAFHRRRRLEDAGPRYRRASCLQPEMPAVHMNLGNLAMDRGEPRTAVRNYRRSLALAAASAVHTNLIFALDFLPEMSVADHQTERRKWAAAYAAPRPIEPHANDRDPSRRLRLGFVSADFREHSAASIFGPIIRRLDRRQFEIVCYSAAVREDGVTAVFRQTCDLWRPVAALADDAVARAIREDRIDIAIDLSGHSGGSKVMKQARS
jgi:protein O-GlcNAc transferase